MKRRPSPSTAAAGFTLIELLIVITVIGILVAAVVPALTTAMEKSRQRATMANMRGVGNQLQIYQNDNAIFPVGSLTMAQVASVLLTTSGTAVPVEDAWDGDFDYQSDGVNNYSIESFGRDGIPGANITPAQANNFDLDLVLSDGQFSAAVN